MLYIGLTVCAPTTITAATHCCTSNLFALIVCSQIPSINGQITKKVQSVNRQQLAWQVFKGKNMAKFIFEGF